MSRCQCVCDLFVCETTSLCVCIFQPTLRICYSVRLCMYLPAGQLLDHIGGNINPLRVIQKIPEGLAIDKLRLVAGWLRFINRS